MNVETIVVDPAVAKAKLKEFRGVVVSNRRKEDIEFRRLYRAAGTGKPILDVALALKAAGVNEKGQPRLALALATWKECYFDAWNHAFMRTRFVQRHKYNHIYLPNDTFDWKPMNNMHLVSPVPFIPPAKRPKDDLIKYHILYEAQDWKEYPADPLLLRQIAGWLFVVEEEWDLTPLERSLLKHIRM